MDNKWDNFFIGLMGCAALTTSLYFILIEVLRPLAENYGRSAILFYPKPELLILAIDVLMFRVFMINLQKQKLGRGWLLGVFGFTVYFFYNYYHQK